METKEPTIPKKPLDIKGAVEGIVTDPHGANLSNAHVTLTEMGISVVTGATGKFSFNNVSTGLYSIEVTHTGFLKFNKGGINVGPGKTATVDVMLKVMAI